MHEETPRVAVVLSGCGVFDGSEIHEAVCTLLALDESGCEYQCFAPNTWQARTIDHFTGNATALFGDEDNRNVLAESARIARGEIKDLSEFKANEFDALLFPGGFGAVTNLSDFALKGPDCDVNSDVRRAIDESFERNLVIGAMCIAPVILARVLGRHKITVTVGTDSKVAAGIQKMGAKHQTRDVTEVCVDVEHKIVTVPAYMSAKSIKDVCRGIHNLVDEMLELIY